jgi:hypothetical protein
MKCEKNKTKFELEIYKLGEIKDSILIKFKKVEGSTTNYREMCQQIMTQAIL